MEALANFSIRRVSEILGSTAYPRGFVYSSARRATVQPSWRESDLFEGLYFDSSCASASASSRSVKVAVLGSCVPVDRPIESGYNPASDLAEHLEIGERAFFHRLSLLCGRYAVFYEQRPKSGILSRPIFKVLTDATGQRTAYYSIGPKPVIASHARLVNGIMPAPGIERPIPHQWGYPGNWTPWSQVRLLSPNTCLDVNSGRIERFFPESAPKRFSVDKSASLTSEMVVLALQNFAAQGGKLRLGLTSGIDSRTTLALLLSSGVKFDTWTYINRNLDRLRSDAAVAHTLAAMKGLPHFTLTTAATTITPERNATYNTATYYAHTRSLVEGMLRHASDWPTFISSNTLEIGRAFYEKKFVDFHSPTSSSDAAKIYSTMARSSIASEIGAFGDSTYDALVLNAFAEFYRTAGVPAAHAHLDPFDVLYWEHRMAAWNAIKTHVMDFVTDTFIPFNARQIFSTLLGVKKGDRLKAAVFKRIIKNEAPELLTIPFNPGKFPADDAASL